MAGQVVRGQRGERGAYRPMVSPLCPGGTPAAMACALLDEAGADTLYVADLDAITGGAPQYAVLADILRAAPGITLWLDAGFADAAAAEAVIDQLERLLGQGAAPSAAACDTGGSAGARVVPVFGSESLRELADLRACSAGRPAILSLDRRGDRRMDPAGCWDHPELWPARVIVMTLERVGAYAGPDIETLAALRARAPGRRLIGAGGVRDRADLARAAASGAEAWLVASALHDRRLARA